MIIKMIIFISPQASSTQFRRRGSDLRVIYRTRHAPCYCSLSSDGGVCGYEAERYVYWDGAANPVDCQSVHVGVPDC